MSKFTRTLILFFTLISGASTVFAQAAPTAATPPPPETASAQFQQWLQNNGYGQPPPIATTTSSPPPPGAGVAQEQVMVSSTTTTKTVGKRPLSYEESQQAMLSSVPQSNTPPPPDSDAAFTMMMQKNMPLTPQQVVLLRQQIDIAQRAASTPAVIPPKPVSTTLMINLAPGTTPPAVRLAQGYVSSLVFIDSSGAPWPIAAYDIGNPKAVNIQWDGKSNILLLQAVSPYMSGNIIIRLVGLPTPVTLEIVSGQRVVDYRVDAHVPGMGPNTKELPLGNGLPDSANQVLLDVLDGIAPAGSKFLLVRGGADGQAWLLGDKMFLRTRLTLLSPGWIGKMTSPDGMQAYELQKASTVLVSRFGEPIELKIEGF